MKRNIFHISIDFNQNKKSNNVFFYKFGMKFYEGALVPVLRPTQNTFYLFKLFKHFFSVVTCHLCF